MSLEPSANAWKIFWPWDSMWGERGVMSRWEKYVLVPGYDLNILGRAQRYQAHQVENRAWWLFWGLVNENHSLFFYLPTEPGGGEYVRQWVNVGRWGGVLSWRLENGSSFSLYTPDLYTLLLSNRIGLGLIEYVENTVRMLNKTHTFFWQKCVSVKLNW